jgi:hypothetical protein
MSQFRLPHVSVLLLVLVLLAMVLPAYAEAPKLTGAGPAAAPSVISVSASPNPVGQHVPFNITVALTGPAAAGGLDVFVKAPLMQCWYTLHINAGASQGTVTAVPESALGNYTISASDGRVTTTCELAVVPIVTNIISYPSPLWYGVTGTVTVFLSGTSTALGGAKVQVCFPTLNYTLYVTVPQGRDHATSSGFTWVGHAGSGSYPVQGIYAGFTKTCSLTVTPILSSIVPKPNPVDYSRSWYVTVTLDGNAPAGGAQVSVAIQGTPYSFSFTIPAGQTSGSSPLMTTPGLQAGHIYTVTASYPPGPSDSTSIS